jgi:hypothetical protein
MGALYRQMGLWIARISPVAISISTHSRNFKVQNKSPYVKKMEYSTNESFYETMIAARERMEDGEYRDLATSWGHKT